MLQPQGDEVTVIQVALGRAHPTFTLFPRRINYHKAEPVVNLSQSLVWLKGYYIVYEYFAELIMTLVKCILQRTKTG
jgi:hypothetical protein